MPPPRGEREQKKSFLWQMSESQTSLPLESDTRKGIPVDCVKERNLSVSSPFSLSFVDRKGTIILRLNSQEFLYRSSGGRCFRAVGIRADVLREDGGHRSPSDDGPDRPRHARLPEQFEG